MGNKLLFNIGTSNRKRQEIPGEVGKKDETKEEEEIKEKFDVSATRLSLSRYHEQ